MKIIFGGRNKATELEAFETRKGKGFTLTGVWHLRPSLVLNTIGQVTTITLKTQQQQH